MEEAKRLIAELSLLMGKKDAQSERRRDEIALWFRDNSTAENNALLDGFIKRGVEEIADYFKSIREELTKQE